MVGAELRVSVEPDEPGITRARHRNVPVAGFFCCAAAVPLSSESEMRMLSPAIVHEVRRLLAEGQLSQRRIAELLGVSRGSVSAILHGKRHHGLVSENKIRLPRPTGPPAYCRTCGGRVYLPCLLCYTRAVLARGCARSVAASHPEAELTLDLAGEQQQRYEKIRVRPDVEQQGVDHES
jgi:predicted XRE-type DNA-binding protein